MLSINNNSNFGTLYPNRKDKPVDSRLSRRERTGVAACSMLGVATSLAILAKTANTIVSIIPWIRKEFLVFIAVIVSCV